VFDADFEKSLNLKENATTEELSFIDCSMPLHSYSNLPNYLSETSYLNSLKTLTIIGELNQQIYHNLEK